MCHVTYLFEDVALAKFQEERLLLNFVAPSNILMKLSTFDTSHPVER